LPCKVSIIEATELFVLFILFQSDLDDASSTDVEIDWFNNAKYLSLSLEISAILEITTSIEP